MFLTRVYNSHGSNITGVSTKVTRAYNSHAFLHTITLSLSSLSITAVRIPLVPMHTVAGPEWANLAEGENKRCPLDCPGRGAAKREEPSFMNWVMSLDSGTSRPVLTGTST